jgi:hypothetical protein
VLFDRPEVAEWIESQRQPAEIRPAKPLRKIGQEPASQPLYGTVAGTP